MCQSSFCKFTGIFAEKMWVAFANAKATHIFLGKILRVYAIFNDQSFNDTLTNNIISLNNLAQLFQTNNIVS